MGETEAVGMTAVDAWVVATEEEGLAAVVASTEGPEVTAAVEKEPKVGVVMASVATVGQRVASQEVAAVMGAVGSTAGGWPEANRTG